MSKENDVLGTESIGKLLIKYSIPAIIGMMVNALYNVVDRMFIGNIPGVGPMAITGLGVTLPIMTILVAFGTLIGVGATTKVSIKLGEGKRDDAEKIIGNSFTLTIILSIIITVFGLLFLNNILTIFGASENTIVYARDYMIVILAGTIFNMFSSIFGNIVRGDGKPKLSAIIMSVGCITNIILDAVFIFVFNMGIQGAAIATVIAQAISTVLGMIYYLGGKSNVRFKKENLKLYKASVAGILIIGVSPFAMQLATSVVQLIYNFSLKTYGGDLAIGAMATVNSISMIFVMPAFGFVQAMQPIVGYNYGAKRYDRARKTLKISLIAATFVFVMGFLLTQFAPEMLVGVFNKDPELMGLTINGLRKYTLAMPVIGISIVGTYYIQSTGKAKMSMLLSLLRQVIILIPLIAILPRFFGVNGAWFAQPIADIIAAVATGVVLFNEVRKYSKIKDDELSEEVKIA